MVGEDSKLRFEVFVNTGHVRHDLLPIGPLQLTHVTYVLRTEKQVFFKRRFIRGWARSECVSHGWN